MRGPLPSSNARAFRLPSTSEPRRHTPTHTTATDNSPTHRDTIFTSQPFPILIYTK